jgi:Tfp pilus assembly protein FimT
MEDSREETMLPPAIHRSLRRPGGFSALELTIVVAMAAVVSAIAIPNLISSRRIARSNQIPREIVSQLRLARQTALNQAMVVTWRYDHTSKEISVIDHNQAGITYDSSADTMAALPGKSLGSNATVLVAKIPLASFGVLAGDIQIGRPSGVSTTALDDGTDATALSASSQINITFQPSGSVVDKNNNPVNRTIFIYNAKMPQQTAYAISVLGTTGRIKMWRYDSVANAYNE